MLRRCAAARAPRLREAPIFPRDRSAKESLSYRPAARFKKPNAVLAARFAEFVLKVTDVYRESGARDFDNRSALSRVRDNSVSPKTGANFINEFPRLGERIFYAETLKVNASVYRRLCGVRHAYI